jgi:methionyl-tRNA synthetase
MSKTAGTAVTLDAAIGRHGVDALRYYLLREIGFAGDGDFTWERFDSRYIADLADGLGNLASRSLAMLDRYRQGVTPDGSNNTDLDRSGRDVIQSYSGAMDRFDLKAGAEAAWSLVTTANQFIVQQEPWALAKAKQDAELDVVLGALTRCLYRLAVLSAPFMPGKALELWSAVGQTGDITPDAWNRLSAPPLAGVKTTKPPVLFPKPNPAAMEA